MVPTLLSFRMSQHLTHHLTRESADAIYIICVDAFDGLSTTLILYWPFILHQCINCTARAAGRFSVEKQNREALVVIMPNITHGIFLLIADCCSLDSS